MFSKVLTFLIPEVLLGSLWHHFRVFLESILDAFGPLWGSLGSLWITFGHPLGSLWGPWAPLGTILDDCCIILGFSDYKKGPEGDAFKILGLFLLVF